MAKRYFFIILFLLGVFSVFPQPYGRGAIHDIEIYAQVPQKAVTRDVRPLPRSFSLKEYSPYPGNQGPYGSCNAWANAYAAKTIAESIGLNRLDRTLTTNSTFSSVFLYRTISDDPTGQRGTAIRVALELMKTQGLPKRLSIEPMDFFAVGETHMNFLDIPMSLYDVNNKYRIEDYGRLFTVGWTRERGFFNVDDPAEKVRRVKKALSENKPVILCMEWPSSFNNMYGQELWIPTEPPGRNYSDSCHAVVAVGYDDDKFGGAFEIQNSWGRRWGTDGYIWIRYQDFGNHAMEAYELIENPMTYREIAEFSGSVEIEMSDPDESMEVEFVNEGYYRTKTSHPSGTLFRYIMNCDEPAYLYSFAVNDADADSYFQIFPGDGELAILDYRENSFAFPPDRPGEIDWLELYGTPGTEYLVVLFSKQPLDIDAIGRRFMNARGNFAARVEQAVGSNFIRPHTARYESDRIAFNAQSPNENAVFGLLLAIDHN